MLPINMFISGNKNEQLALAGQTHHWLLISWGKTYDDTTPLNQKNKLW